ncbi:hypothetical protein [Anabaena sp. CCY 0017]|uniref:hypothetical protein n=1 Tax=Anabaena sp. CCY 0017 TaxID=3103866 RepID=UPI0039C71989
MSHKERQEWLKTRRKRIVVVIPRKLNPEQVRVGYKTEMSHKERQEWLKTRTYSQHKPVNTL